eukprot:gb/GECG01012093.1/.p1 GENE.gb/GECG01012093.1/~~gb/GECG01012093.1/.p1  ORF type:complete len:121 (+),score=4.20 gb/GECG01012093.1/:1-363(+)
MPMYGYTCHSSHFPFITGRPREEQAAPEELLTRFLSCASKKRHLMFIVPSVQICMYLITHVDELITKDLSHSVGYGAEQCFTARELSKKIRGVPFCPESSNLFILILILRVHASDQYRNL